MWVDNGSGYAWVRRDQFYEKGSTVLYRSYRTLLRVKVRNPTNKGWIGAIEFSSNGGATYEPFVCKGCTKGSSTARIAVDGDSDVDAPTTCIDGAYCTLSKQG